MACYAIFEKLFQPRRFSWIRSGASFDLSRFNGQHSARLDKSNNFPHICVLHVPKPARIEIFFASIPFGDLSFEFRAISVWSNPTKLRVGHRNQLEFLFESLAFWTSWTICRVNFPCRWIRQRFVLKINLFRSEKSETDILMRVQIPLRIFMHGRISDDRLSTRTVFTTFPGCTHDKLIGYNLVEFFVSNAVFKTSWRLASHAAMPNILAPLVVIPELSRNRLKSLYHMASVMDHRRKLEPAVEFFLWKGNCEEYSIPISASCGVNTIPMKIFPVTRCATLL